MSKTYPVTGRVVSGISVAWQSEIREQAGSAFPKAFLVGQRLFLCGITQYFFSIPVSFSSHKDSGYCLTGGDATLMTSFQLNHLFKDGP